MYPRPVIAVTATTEVIRGISRVRVNEAYTDALARAGMLPLIVAPGDDASLAAGVIDTVDGLLLTGGEDIAPALYDAVADDTVDTPHARRDRSELALAAAARAAGQPTLAICRGLQLVNVALGGTLVQDIARARAGALSHAPGGRRDARVHAVEVREGSRLAVAVGTRSISVNSSHHQALDRIAYGLVVTAIAPDGIVEAAESSDDEWWMLGVQWHPEELTVDSESWDRAIFDAFRAAVARSAAGAGTR